jgi:hypothetical protein
MTFLASWAEATLTNISTSADDAITAKHFLVIVPSI